eukprot:7466623-Lingulodinium_polyedra.AAC.1
MPTAFAPGTTATAASIAWTTFWPPRPGGSISSRLRPTPTSPPLLTAPTTRRPVCGCAPPS